MIAIDSSALIEVVAGLPRAQSCADALIGSELIISGATLTETLIVASRKDVGDDLDALMSLLDVSVHPVDAEFAERAAAAYRRWGKGFDRASLNYGDSFSYALAELHDCPLLYVGDDFRRTNIRSALG